MHSTNLFDPKRIGTMLEDLRSTSTAANKELTDLLEGHPYSDAAWKMEIGFLKLLTITEVLGLDALKNMVLADMEVIKAKPLGYAETEADWDGDQYLKWNVRLRQYIFAIEALGGPEIEHSITKDLTAILRSTQYPITDPKLFGSVPQCEDDVHRRIEGVLRCVFPDLKHKPQLTKAIKNFEPDTGLPSIQTLIEYKYISKASDVPLIADQILADTRGYHSRDWTTFVYVIYETNRFKPESEWSQLLKECGTTEATSTIVISGEPPINKKILNKKSKVI